MSTFTRDADLAGFASMVTEQSLYVTLANDLERWALSPEELRQKFGSIRQASIFHLPDEAMLELGTALGLSMDEVMHQTARPALPARFGKSFMHTDFRFCEHCLNADFHSPLFQHRAVDRCPAHHSKLLTGCRYCRMRIKLDLATLSRSPFACDDCGWNLAPRRGISPSPIEGVDWDAFKRLRDAISPTTPGATSAEFAAKCCGRPEHLRYGEAISSNTVRRHVVWNEAQLGQRRPKDFEFECPLTPSSEQQLAPIRLALDALRELIELEYPVGPPPNAVKSQRSRDQMTLPAAAFWATVNAYVDISSYRRGRVGSRDVPTTYGMLPDGASQATEIVSQHEVFGLMARQILAFSRFEFTAQIDWEVIPEPEAFAPAWRQTMNAATAHLELRPVATKRSLSRLLRRYGKRQLAAAYYSLARQRLVRAANDGDLR